MAQAELAPLEMVGCQMLLAFVKVPAPGCGTGPPSHFARPTEPSGNPDASLRAAGRVKTCEVVGAGTG